MCIEILTMQSCIWVIFYNLISQQRTNSPHLIIVCRFLLTLIIFLAIFLFSVLFLVLTACLNAFFHRTKFEKEYFSLYGTRKHWQTKNIQKPKKKKKNEIKLHNKNKGIHSYNRTIHENAMRSARFCASFVVESVVL